MRPIQYETASLESLFARQRIATLPELKAALGTEVYITVLRKLRPLGYLCSYSHGGKFYTLEHLAPFDEHGLWVNWGRRADLAELSRGTERCRTTGCCGRGRSRLPTGGRAAEPQRSA